MIAFVGEIPFTMAIVFERFGGGLNTIAMGKGY